MSNTKIFFIFMAIVFLGLAPVGPTSVGWTQEDEQLPAEDDDTRIIPLVYIEADDIMSVLEQLKTPAGRIIFNEETKTFILIDDPKTLDAMEDIIQELDVPIETKEFVLQFAKATEIAEDVRKILSKEVGRLKVNAEENSLTVTDRLLKIEEISRMIQEVDMVGKKIHMDIKVLQIILSDEHETGIDWEAIVSKYQKIKFAAFDTARILPKEKEILSLGTISADDMAILTEALETVGEMKTVFVDEYTTRNQTQVNFVIPTKAVSSFQDKGDNQGYPMMRGDVKLTLLPQIKGEDIINVEVLPSSFVQAEAQDKPRKNLLVGAVTKGADMLWSATRVIPGMGAEDEEKLAAKDLKEQPSNFTSVVEVPDGSTLVIGSMIKEVFVRSLRKIPLLGDLPILGFAFQNEGEKLHNSEVIVFVTTKTVEE